MPHLLHPYKLVLGTSSGDPSPVINWDFLQSQSLTSFSRTSNATLFDSTGQLTYAANNLLLNSATLSTQTVTTGLQAGVSVILSFSGTGSVAISGGYTGSLAGTGVSDRVSLKFTTTTNSLTFTVTGSVTSAQLEAVTYQTTPSTYTATTSSQYYGPRYPYAYNGTTWDAQGLLVEAAGTNLATYSNVFSSWTTAGTNTPTVASSITSPDNTNNSYLLQEDTTSGRHILYVQPSSAANGQVTLSLFAKNNDRRYINVTYHGTAGGATQAGVTFDLQTGSITYTPDGFSGTITNVANGWYRCTVTCTQTSASFFIISLSDRSDASGTFVYGSPSYTGTSKSVYIYGAQFEAGSPATSYIPNLSTGTTTRNADTSLAFSAISLPTGLSFSRASNAMQYDAAGRLTYAPNNIARHSNTFTNASWGSPSTITISSGQSDPYGGSDAYKLVVNSGQTNVAIIQAEFSSSNNDVVAFDLTTGATVSLAGGPTNISAISLGSGWWRVSYCTTTNSGERVLLSAFAKNAGWNSISVQNYSGNLYIYPRLSNASAGTGDGTNGILLYAVTVSYVTYETLPRPCDQVITTSSSYYGPRYDYDPLTRLPKGLLIEEGRTNIAGNTDILGIASWTPYGSSRSGTVTGPNGVANSAQTITASAGGTYHQIQSATIGSTTPNANYTLSVYAKAGTTSFACVNLYSTTQNFVSAVFNLNDTTATIASETKLGTTSGTLVSTRQLYIGNGWFRLSVTGSFNRPDITPLLCIANAATGNTFDQYGEPTFSATGNETISLFGAQVEAGSFPTSYIPNPGIASGARTADVATLTGTALTTLQGSAVSVVAEAGPFANIAAGAAIVWYPADFSLIEVNNAAGTIIDMWNGSASVTATLGGGGTVAQPFRAAIGYSSSGRSIVGNGGTVGAAASTVGSITSVSLLEKGSYTSMPNGYLRKFAAWNVRLSDAKLQQKSVVGATL